MEFQKGERVVLNFDSGGVQRADLEASPTPSMAPSMATPFVGDILERAGAATAEPPVAPSLKASVNGFPEHRKRVPKVSAFKQRQAAAREKQKDVLAKGDQTLQTSRNSLRSTSELSDEKKAIDEENRRKLAAMSEQEIEEERRELLATLSPELIQKLLRRSDLSEGSNERDLYPEKMNDSSRTATDGVKTEEKTPQNASKKVQFADQEEELGTKNTSLHAQEDSEAQKNADQPTPAHDSSSSNLIDDPQPAVHFPTPPQPPDLDPSDPNFLQSLHEKYFPTLPYDPRSLSWMAPIDASDKSSAYHPSHTALNASDLRFDFRGALLAPSVSRSMPPDKGLHHHAAAPEAAGYTVPELAVTARSAVPAQRCVAYQTLGRILYRLGQGEFGVEKARRDGRAGAGMQGPVEVARDPNASDDDDDEDENGNEDGEDAGSAMASGLWRCMDEGRVIETLTAEANRTSGHLTARTFAQEALWNWRRGGGRKRRAV